MLVQTCKETPLFSSISFHQDTMGNGTTWVSEVIVAFVHEAVGFIYPYLLSQRHTGGPISIWLCSYCNKILQQVFLFFLSWEAFHESEHITNFRC